LNFKIPYYTVKIIKSNCVLREELILTRTSIGAIGSTSFRFIDRSSRPEINDLTKVLQRKIVFKDQRTLEKRPGNTFVRNFPRDSPGCFLRARSPRRAGLSVHGDVACTTVVFPALAIVAPCTCHWLHALEGLLM